MPYRDRQDIIITMPWRLEDATSFTSLNTFWKRALNFSEGKLRNLSYDLAYWVATGHKTDNEGNKLKEIQFGACVLICRPLLNYQTVDTITEPWLLEGAIVLVTGFIYKKY
jgi:hypothetical protein